MRERGRGGENGQEAVATKRCGSWAMVLVLGHGPDGGHGRESNDGVRVE